MKIEIEEVNRLLLRNNEIMGELKTTFTNLNTELQDLILNFKIFVI